MKAVKNARPALASRFHLWGGAKIINFLAEHRSVAERYAHLLTPGHVLTALMSQLSDEHADLDAILQYLIVRQFKDQKLTKLEQAGSQSDVRPFIHDLFVDLPFHNREHDVRGDVLSCFTVAANESHRIVANGKTETDWRKWARHPRRARVWFLRGGPGQGKSTVGQYYCQIQRAALLINDLAQPIRVLRAHPTEQSSAEDVRVVATRSGNWPILPRIPLHVELKDYAQWYGKKNVPNEPKGVLSFIADVLSGAIEQKVNAGTLKRALKSRSWVAVFDGLDEVPQDVKDQVASEVTLFINQVAVEQDCDLLSLCTTRPQGYSGQFRDLDCAWIDLLPLSTDRALACARPVISFQRPQEESRRSIALLEASATSPSIRELLTTPLQAHILAVVVRDGERPPDRRWKLYDRFYDVIRRREANRNLPDVRLARLLREDEKLLKTLHNRVGFRLQADAETSSGAETSLDREAFRTLASRTVTQMIEDNIEEKVNILDKAATERLVLINTPENGSKLRFDIRQLQEFFAAECLYDSVKAEELRSRITTLAGDAHWREVMHFLLSSLVENDRSTELSVAIEQLGRLNDGDTDGADRVLQRRAGLGALLAARLLSEGVLEQDRAVRQRFRECLAPMAAFANWSRLTSLIQVRQENSRAWLLAFLLDRLRESAPAENIGAAIVLAHSLPDGHPRVPEVVQFLQKVSGNYLIAILDSFVDTGEGVGTSEWFISLLTHLLTKANWAELGADTINRILWFISNKVYHTPVINGLNPRYEPLLKLIQTQWRDRKAIELPIGDGKIVGIKSATRTYDLPNNVIQEEALLEDAPGVFFVVQLLARFFRVPSRNVYGKILRAIEEAGESLLLPLRALLGFPFSTSTPGATLAVMRARIDRTSDDQFLAMLNSGELSREPIPVHEFRVRGDNPVISSAEIVASYNYSSTAGLELFIILVQSSKITLEKPDTLETAIAELLPSLLANPEPLKRAPWCWSTLLAHAGNQSDTIKSLIISICRSSLPYEGYMRFSIHYRRVMNLAPNFVNLFQLFVVDNEPAILPYFTDLLLFHLQLLGDVHAHFQFPEGILSDPLQTEVRKASLLLSRITADNNLCWSVRCSAAILILLLELTGDSETLRPVATLLTANCNGTTASWLLNNFVTFCMFVCRKPTPFMNSLLRDLFESCRDDYLARARLEQILMIWREASNAPVTTLALRDRWLYRSDS